MDGSNEPIGLIRNPVKQQSCLTGIVALPEIFQLGSVATWPKS